MDNYKDYPAIWKQLKIQFELEKKNRTQYGKIMQSWRQRVKEYVNKYVNEDGL